MDKKILITGASGGIGFLICQTLAEKGYQVVGTMRSTKRKNAAVANELRSMGVQLVEMDVTDEASVNAGVKNAIQLLDGLDIFINNAGIGAMGIQELFTAKDMQKVFDVNVFGVQRVMRAVLPLFRKQGAGTILHTSSCIGRITYPFYGTYSASKWALEAIAENYRTELSSFGIESCIVEPGGMPTAFLDSMLTPKDARRSKQYGEMAHAAQGSLEWFQQSLTANPEQRPQKVADAIAKLLSKPFGKKPFRTVVDFMGIAQPVEKYNKVLDRITKDIYAGSGMEAMLSLNK